MRMGCREVTEEPGWGLARATRWEMLLQSLHSSDSPPQLLSLDPGAPFLNLTTQTTQRQ